MAYPLNVGKAVLAWDMPNGARAINVYGWEKQSFGDLTNGDCATFAAHIVDWYENSNFLTQTNAALKTVLTDDISLAEVTCSDVGPGPTVQATVASGTAGTLTSAPPMPNETAVVTSFYTSHAGRSGRGRTFLPGVSSGTLDQDGTLLNGSRSAIEAIYEALREGLAVNGVYQLCVHSLANAAAYGLTSVVTRSVLHHQRRRNA